MLHCILNTVLRHIHGRRGTPAIKAAMYPLRIVGGTSRGRRGPRALRATPRRRFGFMMGRTRFEIRRCNTTTGTTFRSLLTIDL